MGVYFLVRLGGGSGLGQLLALRAWCRRLLRRSSSRSSRRTGMTRTPSIPTGAGDSPKLVSSGRVDERFVRISRFDVTIRRHIGLKRNSRLGQSYATLRREVQSKRCIKLSVRHEIYWTTTLDLDLAQNTGERITYAVKSERLVGLRHSGTELLNAKPDASARNLTNLTRLDLWL